MTTLDRPKPIKTAARNGSRRTRTGSKMGIIGLSDPTGHYEAVLFSEGLAQFRDLLEPGAAVLLTLSAELQGDDVRARIQMVEPLDQAAATCRRTQMRFADYATKAAGLIDAEQRGALYPRSVAATFDLAIDEAAKQCPATEPLMAFLAQCAPEHIPMTLVEGAIADEIGRLQGVAALAEVSHAGGFGELVLR